MDRVIIESLRPGGTWNVRHAFIQDNPPTSLEAENELLKKAEVWVRQWQAAEPTTQFRIRLHFEES